VKTSEANPVVFVQVGVSVEWDSTWRAVRASGGMKLSEPVPQPRRPRHWAKATDAVRSRRAAARFSLEALSFKAEWRVRRAAGGQWVIV
jgi:hypothetical protein